MHEVLTLSLSQRANHLTTQFFNCQEQALYCTEKDDSVDPTIHLNPTVDKISKTVSYKPRVLMWEARNGFGSLGTFQYSQEATDYYFAGTPRMDDHETNVYNVVNTHPRIPKSEYQTALDSNNTALPRLTKENTKYWSDYSKLIYDSTSFNVLKDWYHNVDEPNLPDYQSLKQRPFSQVDQGVEEMSICGNDFLDNNFRHMLEQTDTLQGVNLVTDMDSGWGGFSMKLIEEIRDELSKTTIFSWGLNESDIFTIGNKPKNNADKIIRNKIKSSLAIRKESDLYFPIFADSNNLTNWQIGGQVCKLFDTFGSLVSQKNLEQRKSMSYLVDCLIDDEELRNTVTSMVDINENLEYSFHDKRLPYVGNNRTVEKDYHEFSYTLIKRGKSDSYYAQDENTKPSKFKLMRELKTTSYKPSDTIPEEFAQKPNSSIKVSTTEKSRDVYRNWNMYIAKHFRADDDREELKDETSNLITAYEYGWYDDDDSGDDL